MQYHNHVILTSNLYRLASTTSRIGISLQYSLNLLSFFLPLVVSLASVLRVSRARLYVDPLTQQAYERGKRIYRIHVPLHTYHLSI